LQAILRARCTLVEGHKDAAQIEYLEVLETDPDAATDTLNDLFQVQPSDVASSEENKPRLRIVESAEVLDLSDFIEPDAEVVRFDDVAGLAAIKKQIERKIILPFSKPSLYRRFRKKAGGGVLLYGPPGCGKTLIARATAGQCNARMFSVKISDVLDMYMGESEHKLRMLFEKARSETPAVLFFDEIEALAGKREHGRSSSSANVVSQFLAELDGFSQTNEGLLVLAATNTPWALDTAFLRPGRFDQLFLVPPPDKEARAAILKLELEGRPTSQDIDIDRLAKLTNSFSGADISHLVDCATDEAIDETLSSGEDCPITQKHLNTALATVKPTTSEWLTTARNYARYANDSGRYNEVIDFIAKNGKKR